MDADLRGYGAGGARVTVIHVTPFVQNCSLLPCEETGKAAVVDQGGEVDRILGVAAEAGVEIEKVLLTHGHTSTMWAARPN